MADITRTKSHNLAPEELKRRIEQLADEMSRRFGIQSRWEGDTCRLTGAALKSGAVTMTKSEVSLELTLGFMAKMLKGPIEQEIDTRLGKLVQG